MKLDRVVEELQITEGAEGLEQGWEQSQAAMPAGLPEFLTPEAIHLACEAAYTPGEWIGAILHAAEAIAASEAATAIAWHARYWMHEAEEYDASQIRSWPRLVDTPLGEAGALLYLVSLMAGYERMQHIHREHDVPEDVIADTLSQITHYFEATTEEQGYPEVVPHLIAWLMFHYTGVIYRLARLQFQFGNNRYDIHAFRNTQSARVVALSADGARFRPDGQVLRPADDCEGSWEAQLSITDEAAQGNPIHPHGYALVEQVRLPLDDWEQVLAPGDPVLHLHIPGGEPMDYDACGEAFEQALAFFPKHFPDYQYNAFMCSSWLLDTALQDLAKPTSNMARFQREVYLFPVGLRDDSLASALFGGLRRQIPEDLSEYPRETSLQRAYLDAVEAGTYEPRAGGCFLLPEDVDWGAQVYLRQWREAGND
ncbi:MAG: hypothetical protein ACOCX2_09250 [Armatimonadota bacterium]